MLCFHLHGFRVMTHRLDAESLDQPDWFSDDESLHVLAANQRDVFAKPAAKLFDQPTPMAIFLGLHLSEDFSCRRVVILQTRCKISVDSPVGFFVRNS